MLISVMVMVMEWRKGGFAQDFKPEAHEPKKKSIDQIPETRAQSSESRARVRAKRKRRKEEYRKERRIGVIRAMSTKKQK